MFARAATVLVLTAASFTVPHATPDGGDVDADFDGDGYADLVIGVPSEDIGDLAGAGVVHVLYGSFGGVTTTGTQIWSQDSPGVLDNAQAGDGFGQAVAAGDFDGDGFDDLAIGAPGEDLFGEDEGLVHVLYGSAAAGLQATGRDDQTWSQSTGGVAGQPQDGDRFGWSLAAGDFSGDGEDDLAVGVPFERLSGRFAAGAVQVLYGSDTDGIQVAAPADQFWTQDSTGLDGVAEANDQFGWSLAAGDLGHGSRDDLAIGVPFESLDASNVTEGVVHVLYGTFGGLGTSHPNDDLWHQDVAGVADSADGGDHFGWSLAIADFDGTGAADLAVGVPDEAPAGVAEPQAGAVHVLYSGVLGLQADDPDDQFWTQDSPGVADETENLDRFGLSVAAAEFGRTPEADLAVGIPGESFAGLQTSEGAVAVLYGSAAGLTGAGSQLWTQDSPGVEDAEEDGDQFGFEVSAAPRGRTLEADLAIGSSEDVGEVLNAGAVNVLYGSSGGLSSASDQFYTQATGRVPDIPETLDLFGLVMR